MKNKTVLITGGCGFIGTSLIARLLSNGYTSIRILDNLSVGTKEDLSQVAEFVELTPDDTMPDSGVALIKGDVREFADASACTKNVGCVVHLAANTGVGPSVEDPRTDMESNVVGTFNLLEASRVNGVGNFVFASSGAPIGECEPPIHEELAPHPVSPYGASKLAGEGYCSAYFRTFKIGTVCLRFGNVYGPRSSKKSSVVAKFIRQALSGETCEIFGDGTQTRDFIYIDDLIRAIQMSMESDVGGEVFQIATGTERTVDEVAQLIQTQMKKHNAEMKLVYSEPRLGDVRRNFSDTTKAKNQLGWQAETELASGVEKTVAYFLESGE